MENPLLWKILFTVYTVSILILNAFMYGIAQFYKKKLDPKAVSKGFLAAIVGLFAAAVLTYVPHPLAERTVSVLITLSSAVSLWNAIVIYYTMKQIRRK
ncbi:MAG: hypothetical protein ACQEQV_03520 [Fibrobacterota bacterium]